MKILIGLILAFAIGGACRFFDIPVPSPPMIPGALLVLATTLGYTSVDRILEGKKTNAAVVQRVMEERAPIRHSGIDSHEDAAVNVK